MGDEAIVWRDVEATRRAIESGEQTALEITEAFLAHIERVEPGVGAWAELWPERARAAAKRLDAGRREGEPAGLLHGVPIGLKDLCDVAGDPTRAGTTALGDRPAAANAEVVDRLEAAGAVLLGKTKMTEGAFVAHHPSVVPPRNPWNAERWTGISSSGSGVAVAAGLATAALGTDTGGSIRFPSAACGLTGLKPTHGRVSLRGVFPCAESLDHVGPMARSVADVARVFAVLAGHDPGDPWSRVSNPPLGPPSALPSSAKGARLGVDRASCEEHVDDGIRAAIEAAIEVFRSLGAEVVEVELPPLAETLGPWIVLASTELAAAHAATFESRADQYGSELREAIERGLQTDGRTVAAAWRARIAFGRRVEGLFDRIDALVAPAVAARYPASVNLGDPTSHPAAILAPRFTAPFDLSGSPCLSLPCGFDADGAPIGFQLVGPLMGEGRLLALGSAYQAATDWHARHPSV